MSAILHFDRQTLHPSRSDLTELGNLPLDFPARSIAAPPNSYRHYEYHASDLDDPNLEQRDW